jgi:hypothetical protein
MAGRSLNPLFGKLGFKGGSAALLLNIPSNLEEIAVFPGFVSVGAALLPGPRRHDAVHWFETGRARPKNSVDMMAEGLQPDGMLWISRPKKTSRIPTDANEDVLREIILPIGLADMKVCAVDEVWSDLKFMWRRDFRSAL